jgi:hypothetical protein
MKRTRLSPVSAKRRALGAERARVRIEVLARADGACQYADVVPEVRCAFYTDRPGLEVDELRGGSYRVTEWLDPNACRAVCPAHHDHKTGHKRDVLERLAAWEGER